MNDFILTIQDQFAVPSNEVEMSAAITLAEMSRGGLARITELNWLNPLRTSAPSPFHRADIFARPTAAELALGWQNIGGVRIVNCLNPALTGFPSLIEEDIKELGGGPYLISLAKRYLTSYRISVVQNQPYVNLLNYHNDRRQANFYSYASNSYKIHQIYDSDIFWWKSGYQTKIVILQLWGRGGGIQGQLRGQTRG